MSTNNAEELRGLAGEAEAETNLQEAMLRVLRSGPVLRDYEFQKHVLDALILHSRMIRDLARAAAETG